MADPDVVDPATVWYVEEFGGGCMILTQKLGSIFPARPYTRKIWNSRLASKADCGDRIRQVLAVVPVEMVRSAGRLGASLALLPANARRIFSRPARSLQLALWATVASAG